MPDSRQGSAYNTFKTCDFDRVLLTIKNSEILNLCKWTFEIDHNSYDMPNATKCSEKVGRYTKLQHLGVKSTETTQSPSEASQIEVPPSSFVPLNSDARPSKIPRVEDEALDLSNLEREPGLHLSDIVNIASASSKRHDELQKAQAAEISRLVSINELATGTGMNQIGTLQRPDMNAQYIVGRSRNKKEDVTVEHHYRVDIFFATIDTQLQELKSRFNKNVVELLTLTTALNPKEFFKLFDIDKICILVNKFYPKDFS
ncbi:hypothetical protein GOBAR_AA38115 [Gossypium barbadense]|uniref:Uncharacterized protein n=1 Tax=Gossypium barbadense TaxID=3634 RepID=A0A2P5VUS2_GOSBA|nr:hypothetical protein GOBAR_AA38115 [Gossypium barbadense]